MKMSIHVIKNGKNLQVRWRGPEGKQCTKMFDNTPDGRRAAERFESEIKRRKAALKKAVREATGPEPDLQLSIAPLSANEEASRITLPPELKELAAHLEWFKDAALFVAGRGDGQFVLRFDLLASDNNELYILGRNLRHWKAIFMPAQLKGKMVAAARKHKRRS